MRGMRSVYALPMSLMMVSWSVNVTTWPAETLSCTHTRAVRYRLGTTDSGYDPIWDVSSTGSVSMLPYLMEIPGGAGRMFDSHSGVVVSRRRGAVVIMAPLSRTALGCVDIMDDCLDPSVAAPWRVLWAMGREVVAMRCGW